MQLKEIMTPGVEVIAPEATLQEAAEKMRHLDIGPLPVCDGDRLVGLLTDRDITVRAVAEGRNPATTQVREVMTPEVIYGYEEQDSQDAAVSPQKSGAESPCSGGWPRRRKSGIMARHTRHLSPLEPAALCLKTLTCTAS
jgi:CBS domain-containing protein